MDAALSMRDVASVCNLSDHACRKLFRDPALSQTYTEQPGPNAGRPRRYWRLVSLIPVLRGKHFFTPVMERDLVALDIQRRNKEIENA
ncbi:hypothetical protein [Rhodovulum sp. P5]|uniref:hypothetical protein n=1 Tax=Rhodovulum sp. P5 TaxID=1564506 RepID=UPI0009DAB642|nr:hypothetical protein [Rhodovulum sp. P5]